MENDKKKWQNLFFNNFLDELDKAGYTPEEIAKYVWKPFLPEDLVVSGPDKDLSFFKVQAVPGEISRYLERKQVSEMDVDEFCKKQKLVLILLPGFTHHTLQYPAFIAQKEFLETSLDIVKLSLGADGGPTEENFIHQGGGVKLAYLAYPRSNAPSEILIKPMFEILNNSKSLKKWVLEENRKIVFIGYSYGAPLSLELLAAMNTGSLPDSFIVKNTIAYLAINGDIKGSYLADSLVNPTMTFNAETFITIAELFNPIGLVLGIKTDEERKDFVTGMKSLTHVERQSHLQEYMDKIPTDIKYFSVCAFLPEEEYDNVIWRNFDDWNMHKQSLFSKDVSIYNDGQMVLEDCFIPDFPNVPKENKIDLGAVRSHHWGVSWLTMTHGKNKFPRFCYYRALIRTLNEAGVGHI
ncbi:MAG: hypothetical protein HQK79_18460 [Desulfobacterales bacterium]|nr:hypothetical protein [Desulfobacterales bacterium]